MMEPTQLARLKKEMDERAASEQMLAAALNATMANPHTVEQIHTFGFGYFPDENGGTISIATPSGRRVDLIMDKGTKRALLLALQGNGHDDEPSDN